MSESITYAPDEKKCQTCGKVLGKIVCSIHRTCFFCDNPSCRFPLHMNVPIQFIAKNKICDAKACPNLAMQRAYPAHQKVFFCSDKCMRRHRASDSGPEEVRCAHCGLPLGRRSPTASGLHFCMGHHALYRREQQDVEQCGPLLKHLHQFDAFAEKKYRDSALPRQTVRAFLACMNGEGVTDINLVTVDNVGFFEGKEKEHLQTPRLDFVKVFFDHLIVEGAYNDENPVRARLHYYKQHPKSTPRIYDVETRANLWIWAEERGDTRAKLVLAFGEEFGPSVEAVCDIQLKDLDSKDPVIWFRDLSATSTNADYLYFAPYGEKTKQWLAAWLSERPKNLGHDYLLTNVKEEPLRPHSLRDILNGVFCRKSKFREYSTGLKRFSYDRLRDTNIFLMRGGDMKDDVNMFMHGIKCFTTIERFDLLLTPEEREQYRRAQDGIDQ